MILTLGTTTTVQRTMVFPALQLNGVNRATKVVECASGKSLNVARVVATLGHEVLATGFAGGDRGRFMKSDLDQAHIPHDFVSVTPNTRFCTTVIDEAGHTHTELVEESPALDPNDYQHLLQKLRDLLPQAKVLTLSGSLPINGPTNFYRDCIETARTVNPKLPILLDAQNQHLLQSLPAKPFLVKPNRTELAAAMNITIDDIHQFQSALNQVVHSGATWACATNGGEYALLSNGREAWKITPPKIKVLNTIGSGDSFLAGLAVSLAQGLAPPEALPLATAAAAANALTLQPGFIQMPDVARLLQQVHVEKLSN